MAMFVTVAFDDEDTGEKFCESMDLNLSFVTTNPGSMLVRYDDVRPTRIMKIEFLTKED